MKRSKRIERINLININKEHVAGADLAVAHQQFDACYQQLQQLYSYKEEYKNKLNIKSQSRISPKEMQDYQYFFSSLQIAITQQREVIEQAKKALQDSEDNWLDKHQEVKKFDLINESIKQQEQELLDKFEQQQLDELSAQIHAGTFKL